LGQTLVEDCAGRGIRVRPVSADAVGERASIAALFVDHAPWAVIDARLRRGSLADRSNGWSVRHTVERAGILAEACAERSVPLVVVSSGLVFDGAKGVPYVESDPVAPVDPQGKVHAAVEAIVAEHHPAALVVRAGHLLPKAGIDVSPLGEHVGDRMTGLATLADQTQRSSFAALPDLSASLLDLLIDGERGVWHLAHPEPASWEEIIRACTAGDPDSSLVLSPEHVLAAPAAWPVLSSGGGVLGSERGWVMPPLSTAIARWTQHVPSAG
ncbi:MAG TPA: sugar nucleotide-binding protein, partial [Thermomicrobiales bacterium]|nr:sugar nucleotide-binding protein [Thermomicrobiales bacterium]